MIRILKLALVFTLLAGAVLYFILPTMLNKGIKLGVESVGPKITKTEVRIEKVNISPFNGKGSIKGFFVGNPEGFTPDKTFFMSEISLDIEPSTLFSGDRILINRVYVNNPEIVFEQKLNGTNNFSQLIKNINESIATEEESASEQPSKEDETEEQPKTESKPLKIEITEFTIEESSINVILAGKKFTVSLPKIQIEDIGKEKGGITPEQAVQEILAALAHQAKESVKNADELLPSKDSIKEAAEGILKSTEDLFN